MMLIEETAVAEAALPVQAFTDHLRLGTGFAGVALQEGLVAGHLRAAMAVIEARTGKALLARRFRLDLSGWRDAKVQALPVAPVGAVISVTLYDAAGGAVVLPPELWRLQADSHRPRLVAMGSGWPEVAEGGRAEIRFDAGFAADWEGVPADLAQAVLLLAAEFYERRHEGGEGQGQGQNWGLPFGVQVLIERWRIVRSLGGGR